MSGDPIFRKSRLAKMASDNVILAVAYRAHTQKASVPSLSVSKIQKVCLQSR